MIRRAIERERPVTLHSSAEFVRLRTSEDRDEYIRSAHEDASLEVWYETIEQYPDMRFWVAHNKTVPVEILRVLANDPDRNVRSMVADKRKAPSDVLEKLANDVDSGVRMRVTVNKKTPTPTLEKLRTDEWAEIRSIAQAKCEKRRE